VETIFERRINMLTNNFEEEITPDLKWNKVEDIPNLPFSSFDEVKQKLKTDDFSIGIDFTTSNQLAQWLYGKGFSIFFLILASTPIIVAIIAIVSSFVLGNYWLLVGIILGFTGQFMSNPYNPAKKFWKPIVGTLFLVFVYSLWQGKETMTFLSAFFVFPFFINSYLYDMNQGKLERVALESEKFFIYLYQTGKLGLKHNESGKSYWNHEFKIL
jgi:hypothetical protein